MIRIRSCFDKLMTRMHGPVYRKRIEVLTRMIVPHLQPGDRVLDVGCGYGTLAAALMADPSCPGSVQIHGLERAKRGGEAIPVQAYDGVTFPHDDNAFDVVIIADVLHHEADPDRLIAEAVRVAKRSLIIKDHKRDGLLAQQRISFMDWAANTAYGVPCLFRYNTLTQWHDVFKRHHLPITAEHTRMTLYPMPYPLMFTSRLQYLAVLNTDRTANEPVIASVS